MRELAAHRKLTAALEERDATLRKLKEEYASLESRESKVLGKRRNEESTDTVASENKSTVNAANRDEPSASTSQMHTQASVKHASQSKSTKLSKHKQQYAFSPQHGHIIDPDFKSSFIHPGLNLKQGALF